MLSRTVNKSKSELLENDGELWNCLRFTAGELRVYCKQYIIPTNEAKGTNIDQAIVEMTKRIGVAKQIVNGSFPPLKVF